MFTCCVDSEYPTVVHLRFAMYGFIELTRTHPTPSEDQVGVLCFSTTASRSTVLKKGNGSRRNLLQLSVEDMVDW